MDTELCLGLPGGGELVRDQNKNIKKRGFSETVDLKLNLQSTDEKDQKMNINTAKDNSCNKESVKPPAKWGKIGKNYFSQNYFAKETLNFFLNYFLRLGCKS
ncbi:hypothetical protein P3L10_018929 [Capsicum annuum]